MGKENKKWVAVYLRTSTKNQNSTFELQKTHCEKYIKNKYSDFNIQIYNDMDSNREQLNKMISDIQLNKVETVIVNSFERLSRNAEELLELNQIIEDHKCKLVSVDRLIPCNEELLRLNNLSYLDKMNQEIELPVEMMTSKETMQLPIDTKLDIKKLTKWPNEATLQENNLKLFYEVHCVVPDEDCNIAEEYDVMLDSIADFDEWGWKEIFDIEKKQLLKTMKLINIVIKTNSYN